MADTETTEDQTEDQTDDAAQKALVEDEAPAKPAAKASTRKTSTRKVAARKPRVETYQVHGPKGPVTVEHDIDAGTTKVLGD